VISRPLDPGEAFFFMSDHVSSMNFVVFAQRDNALPLDRIEPALAVLQQENALLQTRITWTEEDGLRFEPAPGLPIALHCQQRSSDAWQELIEAELSLPFAVGSAPLVRCHAITLQVDAATTPQAKTTSVLALTFHHAIADGRSGAALLRRLLALLACPMHQSQPRTAIALEPMSALMPTDRRWAEHPQAAKALRDVMISDYRRHGKLSPLPWLASQAPGRSPRFFQVTLPADVGHQLRTLARQHGTTLHGLICAAQLLAQRTLQDVEDRSTFFLSCPVDLRPQLVNTPPVTPTAMLISLVSNTFQIDDNTAIWPLARAIIEQTRLQLARGEAHLLYHLFGLTGAPVRPSQLEPFAQKVLASLPNTMVSNIGAVAAVPEDPHVQAISFALCPMPYQTLFTAASSYADRLILNVGFDAQRVSPECARKLAQSMQERLLLQVGESVPTPCE